MLYKIAINELHIILWWNFIDNLSFSTKFNLSHNITGGLQILVLYWKKCVTPDLYLTSVNKHPKVTRVKSGNLLCPRHKVVGAYSFTLVRYSATTSFPDFFLNALKYWTDFWSKVYIDDLQIEFEFCFVSLIFEGVVPLELGKIPVFCTFFLNASRCIELIFCMQVFIDELQIVFFRFFIFDGVTSRGLGKLLLMSRRIIYHFLLWIPHEISNTPFSIRFELGLPVSDV